MLQQSSIQTFVYVMQIKLHTIYFLFYIIRHLLHRNYYLNSSSFSILNHALALLFNLEVMKFGPIVGRKRFRN